MRLSFNNIVYSQKYEVDLDGQQTLDVLVELTSEEAEEINTLLINILDNPEQKTDRIDEILFKDRLPEIKSAIKGVNFKMFCDEVLVQYSDFFIKSHLKRILKVQSEKKS